MSTAPFGDLTGRVALITGAGRGIGPGIAAALADAGADVAINAYTGAYVVPLAARLTNTTGRRVIPVVGDATTTAGVAGIVGNVLDRFAAIDILVNGVGDAIPGPLALLPDQDAAPVTDADITRIVDLNLTSTLLASRAVAPVLIARGGGVVVNIAGAAALRGGGGMAVYTAAKAAVAGLTRALALEWAQVAIRVNAVAPGIVPDPDRPDFFDPDTAARYRATIPARRFGTPREVGDLVRYLASAEASYLTGQTVYLDGGLTL
jgi:NAD(P)-dependent dehydrogenase (short-subunit alcohol dehydrogenase family)